MRDPLRPPLAARPRGPTRVRWRVLAVLCSLAFLTYLDRICIMRVQGEIERDLGFGALTEEDEASLRAKGLDRDPEARADAASRRATGRMKWVFAAFLAGYMLFEIPGGWLGDRRGARWVIVRIVVGWSVFTALTGSVERLAGWIREPPGPELYLAVLVLVRFLFGAAEAGAYPNIARAVGRWFPFHERAAAQGAIWMASRLGGAFAPMAIGALMALPGGWGGWRQAFWILGGIGIVWAAAFALWFRDRPEDKPEVSAAECEAIRAGAGEAGSIYDDRGVARLPWRKLFLSANLLSIYAAHFTITFSWYFNVTFLPKYLKEQFGVDYSRSELLTGLPLLVGGLACLAGGRLSDFCTQRTGSKRWGRSLIGIAGYAAAGCCALAVTQLDSPIAVMVFLCIGSAFQDLAVPCIWSLPVDVGGRFAGTVGGSMNSIGAIGGILSPLVVGGLAGADGAGWNAAFLVFAGSYFLGALAWLRVDAGERIAGA